MKRQKKWEIHIRDVGRDRISDLPDHVLLRILECMKIKRSVRTCVLSKRWKNLWKSLTKLSFNNFYNHGNDIFNKFVSHILSGRDNTLSLHSLTYIHHGNRDDPHIATILEVIKYATSHNVKQLKVDVNEHVLKELELPSSIFYCRSLTFLHLHFWHDSYDTMKMIPKSLNFPVLKTLHLENLSFTTSDNDCAEPFSTCNMLSTLVIKSCRLHDDTQTLYISNSNVSSLTVEWNYFRKVVMSTPKLTSLTIGGLPTVQPPSACNLPFLEEVKIMTLGFDTLEETFKVLENNGRIQPPCFVRLKSWKVKMDRDSTISNESVREMLTYLLQNSPLDRVEIIRETGLDEFSSVETVFCGSKQHMDRAIQLEDNSQL